MIHPIARTPAEWTTTLAEKGERAFVAKQVFGWIHKKGVFEPAKMSNLSVRVRELLAADGLTGILVPEHVHRSTDGTRKLVLRLHDGATIETVLLPGVSGASEKSRQAARSATQAPPDVFADVDADIAAAEDDDEEEEPISPGVVRVTQCISTQVGCAMGCVFCASGVAGLKRHLGPEEIVGQVLLAKEHLDSSEQLRNVVLMGMGEPLHNYDATARALRLLTHPDGIGLSTRRVTVSTSGLVPEIERLGKDFGGQIALAISLHAADDVTRSAMMPINRRYPLGELMAALRSYPLPKRRRITIEYTLVAGKNDGLEQAAKVAALLSGLRVKINLIPMNPISASALGPSEWRRVLAFQSVLISAGYSCFVRRRRGDDVAAACGQLVLLGAKPKVKGFQKGESV